MNSKKTGLSIIAVFLTLIMLLQPLFGRYGFSLSQDSLVLSADAATDIISTLKAKYPAGKYWNGGNADTYTSTPCTHHGSGCSYSGGCWCNNFKSHCIQCMGFAYQLAYLCYGGDPYVDRKANHNTSALDSLKPGDIIRYKNDGHSIYVYGVSGDTITYADCNSDGHCIIRWDQTISKSTVRSTFSYVDPAPYALPIVEPEKDTRYSVPFTCRIISTTKVKCYNDASFGSSPGYIYPEDDCEILAIYTNGVVQCTCPWSDGTTKTVYIDRSEFIVSSNVQDAKAVKKATTYLRTDFSTSIGWIDPGDSIQIVGTSGDKTQIIYPKDVGKRCAWVYSSDLVCTNHSWNSGTITKSATCTDAGIRTYTCNTCGTTKTESIAALGHNWSGWSSVSDSQHRRTCTRCSLTDTVNHSWNSGTVTSAATYFKPGVKTYTCTVCSTTKTETIPVLDSTDAPHLVRTANYNGHSYYLYASNYDWTTAKEWCEAYGGYLATITSAAEQNVINQLIGEDSQTSFWLGAESETTGSFRWITCENWTYENWQTGEPSAPVYETCLGTYLGTEWNDFNNGSLTPKGFIIEKGDIDESKTSHLWNLGTITTSPTCTSSGVKTYICTACNTVKTETIASTGHSWNAWERQDDTYHLRVCKNNPSHTEQEEHEWDEGVITKEPNATEPGIRTYHCTVCNAERDEEIPAIGPQYTAGDINGDGVVNNKDLTRLMKYLSGEDVEVTEAALDVNGDGTVNNKDLTRLMKYLAGEDVQIN